MSQKFKTQLEVIALTLGIGGGLFAFFGAYFVLPHRVEAVERLQAEYEEKQKETDKAMATQKELLVRIEERLISVQQQLKQRTP